MTPYNAIRARLARSPEAGAAAGFSAVFLVFALAAPDTFLTHSAISSILNSQVVPGILAIGITLLMISGEFDLSVGSVLGVSSLAFLYATVNDIHILLAAALGLTTGGLLGMLNGFSSCGRAFHLLLLRWAPCSFIAPFPSQRFPAGASFDMPTIRARPPSSTYPVSCSAFSRSRFLSSFCGWRGIFGGRKGRSIPLKSLLVAGVVLAAYFALKPLVFRPQARLIFFFALNGRMRR